jgi:TonB family protein
MFLALALVAVLQRPDSVILEDSLAIAPAIDSTPTLNYPLDMLTRGRQGRVLVQFVLDTMGHAERNSIRVVATPFRNFNLSAKAFIRDAVFTPGVYRGRRVRVLMVYPVDFHIRGGS